MKSKLSLTIKFSGPPAAIDHNWIRLVQTGLKPAQATIGETADLVDAVYHIDPCNPQAAAPPVDQQDFQALVKQEFDLALCDTDPDGSTHAQLQVILSDPATPYGLRLDQDAVIEQTVAVDEEVSLRLPIEDASSLVLPYPVTGGRPVFGWGGDRAYGPGGLIIAPDIDRDGNTLVFDYPLTGIVTAEYLTRYFLVNITFPGDQDCRALCFAMGLVAELDLQRPESQGTLSDWEKYCNPQTKWVFNPPDGVTCYEEVELSYRCECDTNQESRSITIRRGVPCPDGFITWGVEPGDYKIGDKYEIAGYEHCPDLAVNYGSQDLSDPDYYAQLCCNPPPQGITLPHCATVTSKNPGGAALENGEDYYRKIYGPATRFVPVAPADGDCGTMETKQDVYQHNCCDGVTPIYWDYDNSAEVIADNSKGLVTVTGGRPPYTWQVRGSGFWADAAHAWRDVETDVPYLWLYTQDSCGTCDIYVTDGCSSSSGLVRSDVGQWSFLTNNPEPCLVTLDCGAPIAGVVNDCVQGKYKSSELWGGLDGYCCDPDCAAAINYVCSWYVDLYPSCSYSSPPPGYTDCGTGHGSSYMLDPDFGALNCPGAVTWVTGVAPHLYVGGTNKAAYWLYQWTC